MPEFTVYKDRKQKGHLRNESMLKAMPPDILRELVRWRLEEIEKAKQNLTNTKKPSGGRSLFMIRRDRIWIY
jgi:hypothetical protein